MVRTTNPTCKALRVWSPLAPLGGEGVQVRSTSSPRTAAVVRWVRVNLKAGAQQRPYTESCCCVTARSFACALAGRLTGRSGFLCTAVARHRRGRGHSGAGVPQRAPRPAQASGLWSLVSAAGKGKPPFPIPPRSQVAREPGQGGGAAATAGAAAAARGHGPRLPASGTGPRLGSRFATRLAPASPPRPSGRRQLQVGPAGTLGLPLHRELGFC